MIVKTCEHSQTPFNAYGNYVLMLTSKTSSMAIDAVGQISTGYAFTSKFMQEQLIVKRMSEAALASRLIKEMARVARDTLPYKDLPEVIYTDLGFRVEGTFLEWSSEAGLYLLYVVTEGVRVPVKTNGKTCKVHNRGTIDTTLLFCVPFYTLTRGMGIVSVDIPDGYLYTIEALLNGVVMNHNYLAYSPSVFFSYIIQEHEDCEVIGNKSIIADLKRRKWLSYVK